MTHDRAFPASRRPPPADGASSWPDLEHIEVLNELGRELSLCTGARAGYGHVIDTLRRTLGFARASLWTCDARVGLLVKEAACGEDAPTAEELRADEQLTRWQLQQRVRVIAPGGTESAVGAVARLDAAAAHDARPYAGALARSTLPAALAELDRPVVSLPILDGAQLLAVLNLYADAPGPWYFEAARAPAAAEFFLSVAGMMEIHLRTKALEAHTTFYKEVHHRVKNNLQTVASLLRMQLRRLDRVSAARALEDSIGRIESIALVHETLSQGEIGLVDLGDLVGRIARLAAADADAAPPITLERPGAPVMLTSKQATALALVANELVQNAIVHARGATRVDVAIGAQADTIRFVVEDDGAGLPLDFAPERDGNLGLSIVRELTVGELSGQFALVRRDGRTRATVTFPAGIEGATP
jgi:two-component sensor histidine kinase